MFIIKYSNTSVITFTSDFDLSKLDQDGKFSLVIEGREVDNPERRSSCEVIVPFVVDKFPPYFEKTFYTHDIVNLTVRLNIFWGLLMVNGLVMVVWDLQVL